MYRVLVADDEVTVCKGLSRLIPRDRYGFTVDGFAHNGRHAIEEAIGSRFDLVITDIRMPVVDGLTVLRRLREVKAPNRTIVLSAYRDFEYARVAIENGARAYLLKPVDEALLVGALEEIRGELDAMDPAERTRGWEAAPRVAAGQAEETAPSALPLVLHKHSSTHAIEQ